jgi:hypothetical protein
MMVGFDIENKIREKIEYMKVCARAMQPPHHLIVYPESNPYGRGIHPEGAKKYTLIVALTPDAGMQGTRRQEIREASRFDFYVALCQLFPKLFLQ